MVVKNAAAPVIKEIPLNVKVDNEAVDVCAPIEKINPKNPQQIPTAVTLIFALLV